MATAKRKRARPQAEVVIPDKIYFRIGEVSELAKLPTYVLRFWETEFPQLKPTKSSTGQRMYRRRDVEYVIQIRKLLYEDGFTIAGAREKLREGVRLGRLQPQASPQVLSRPERAVGKAASVAHSETQAQGKAQPQGETQVLSQPVLPFPAQDVAANSAQNREELRRVRQQLRDVLDLLS
jgi:DNA-binding transcriptional MerR regulator